MSVTLPTVKLDRVGNVGIGEDLLIQMFLPPGLFKSDGDCLLIHSNAILAANANAKTTKLYIAGTVVAGRTASDNNSVHDMRVRCYKRGGTIWCCGLTANLITALQLVQQNDISPVDFNSAIEIKLTGEAVNDNDIVSRVLEYTFFPANVTFPPL